MYVREGCIHALAHGIAIRVWEVVQPLHRWLCLWFGRNVGLATQVHDDVYHLRDVLSRFLSIQVRLNDTRTHSGLEPDRSYSDMLLHLFHLQRLSPCVRGGPCA